jgi:hypothetical protein
MKSIAKIIFIADLTEIRNNMSFVVIDLFSNTHRFYKKE